MNNSITFGSTGPVVPIGISGPVGTLGPIGINGPVGISGIQTRIWNRVIKINKLKKIWDIISVI
jgi:hypothetical protein